LTKSYEQQVATLNMQHLQLSLNTF